MPRLAVVHNGIIENFAELRAGASAEGYKFETETDTEAVAQFRVTRRELNKGKSPVEAVRDCLALYRRFCARSLCRMRIAETHQSQGPPLAAGLRRR